MNRSAVHQYLASVSGTFSLEAFDSLGLKQIIQDALDEAGGREKKDCPLKSPLIVVLVLLMNLHRHLAIVNVFKGIVSSLRTKKEQLPLAALSEQALYHGRSRVGAPALAAVFTRTAKLIERRPNFHSFRTVAADGVHFTVPDTAANSAAFGRPDCGRKSKAAFPQLKGVTMIATESREVIAAAFGPYGMAESPIVEQFVEQHLTALDFLIVDRGLPSFVMFQKCNKVGAHYLARISSQWHPRIVEQRAPGDYIVTIRVRMPAPPEKRRQKHHRNHWVYMTVRMIQYTFRRTGEVIRLLTDLLDNDTFTALELAELYHERWEVELGYDELKTHLETIPHGSAPTVFRSQTPDGVLQEAYGMLAVYNLMRHMMCRAAVQARLPADQISFVATLNVIRLAIPRLAEAATQALPRLQRQLLADIGASRIDRPRRKRCYARVVRIKFIRFPKKRPEHRQEFFDFKAEIHLVDSALAMKAA